jgi:hypothetical protein
VKAFTYLVVGSTGEYSDHSQWNVAAYTTRGQAEEHCRQLEELVAETRAEVSTWEGRDQVREQVRKRLDPACAIDYNGAVYVVEEVPLVVHLDEWLEEHAPPTAHA